MAKSRRVNNDRFESGEPAVILEDRNGDEQMETKEKWTETTNYENFLRNCRKYGMSKRLWIRSGRPNQKPNGEKINLND